MSPSRACAQQLRAECYEPSADIGLVLSIGLVALDTVWVLDPGLMMG
jgi:hypothetical protein